MSTRDQILEIAYRAFAEKGYNHTSMGAIAEELGITRPALYYHFSSKEDLLLATYEMIDPLSNVSADEVLGCTEPAEFEQAFATLIASITRNLRNDEQRARFVATVESTSGQIPAITESAQAQYDETMESLRTAAASSGASRSLACWRWSPRCWCSTNPLPGSTRAVARKS